MAHYKYLIIGGGMTGDAAAQGIRELDCDGSIGLIGEEKDMPYNRPPVSKGLGKGKPLETIWRHTEKHNVDLHLGRRVEHEDNANVMGRTAGRNMAGAEEPYHYLPYFYSDLIATTHEFRPEELNCHLRAAW